MFILRSSKYEVCMLSTVAKKKTQRVSEYILQQGFLNGQRQLGASEDRFSTKLCLIKSIETCEQRKATTLKICKGRREYGIGTIH